MKKIIGVLIIILLLISSATYGVYVYRNKIIQKERLGFVRDYIKVLYEFKQAGIERDNYKINKGEGLSVMQVNWVLVLTKNKDHYEKAISHLRPYTKSKIPEIQKIAVSHIDILNKIIKYSNDLIENVKNESELRSAIIGEFGGSFQILKERVQGDDGLGIYEVIFERKMNPETGSEEMGKSKLNGNQLQIILSDIDIYFRNEMNELRKLREGKTFEEVLKEIVFTEGHPYYIYPVLVLYVALPLEVISQIPSLKPLLKAKNK